MPSRALFAPEMPFSAFSTALIAFQFTRTASASSALASAKICGCLRIILVQIASAMSPSVNIPLSRPSCAWKAICKRTSPSSSTRASVSSESIASATSYASSRRYLRSVSWDCLRSQGQPVSGSRRRAMISLKVLMSAGRCSRGSAGTKMDVRWLTGIRSMRTSGMASTRSRSGTPAAVMTLTGQSSGKPASRRASLTSDAISWSWTWYRRIGPSVPRLGSAYGSAERRRWASTTWMWSTMGA